MVDFAKLKAPFPRERISWRAQHVSNGKALALAYIDARDVQDRLDDVVGPENWQNDFPHANGKTVCRIGLRIGGEWIWKSDGAGDTDVEAEKGALSDAFKRAAVKWGIGRYLYDIETPWVPCEVNDKGKFKCFKDDPWKHVKSMVASGGSSQPKPAPASPSQGEAPKASATTLVIRWPDGKFKEYDDPRDWANGLLAAVRINPAMWDEHKDTARKFYKDHPEIKAAIDAALMIVNDKGKAA